MTGLRHLAHESDLRRRPGSRRARAGWVKMSKTYLGRAQTFLDGVDSPTFHVAFERLIGGKRIARASVAELAEFVGAPKKNIAAAMRRIK